MICPGPPPIDGSAWVELARCLEDHSLPEAAARAWRHAWEADPSVADRALSGSKRLAHQTGDDGLLVDIAATMPEITDPDVAGHLAFARAASGDPDARELLASVPVKTCRRSYAQVRLAAYFGSDDKLKSQVMALRDAIDAARTTDGATLGRGPLWESWSLADAALLQIASVYARLERPEKAAEYAAHVTKGAPLYPAAAYFRAWAADRSGDPETALAEADAAAVVPEASAIAVRARAASPGGSALAAREAHAFWDPVRTTLVTFRDAHAAHPETAPDALRGLALPDGVLALVGAAGPMATMWMRSYGLDREAKRARRNPVASALVAEAEAALDAAFGEAILAAVSHGVDRIDAAMAEVDTAGAGLDRPLGPHVWTLQDFGR